MCIYFYPHEVTSQFRLPNVKAGLQRKIWKSYHSSVLWLGKYLLLTIFSLMISCGLDLGRTEGDFVLLLSFSGLL